MNITKEQIKEWVDRNNLECDGFYEGLDFERIIYDCMQALAPECVGVREELPEIGENETLGQ